MSVKKCVYKKGGAWHEAGNPASPKGALRNPSSSRRAPLASSDDALHQGTPYPHTHTHKPPLPLAGPPVSAASHEVAESVPPACSVGVFRHRPMALCLHVRPAYDVAGWRCPRYRLLTLCLASCWGGPGYRPTTQCPGSTPALRSAYVCRRSAPMVLDISLSESLGWPGISSYDAMPQQHTDL